MRSHWICAFALGACTSSSPVLDASAPDAGTALGQDAGFADALIFPDADVGFLDAAAPGDADVGLDAASDPDAGHRPDASGPPVVSLPPPNAPLDYQLGGAYPPPPGVQIVSRDRTAAPAPGLYNICYINGFQIQPGEEGDWEAELMLRDGSGNPIIDPDWNEVLLDVSTASKRARIAAMIGQWIAGCANAGYDAVEIDNLDTYSRSGGRISEQDAVDAMVLFAAEAHRFGLAIAQKNSAELLSRRADLGTDFAVVEECSRYQECGDFTAAYGAAVLMIEYRRRDFDAGCRGFGSTHSIVLRDLDLVAAGRSGYVYDGC